MEKINKILKKCDSSTKEHQARVSALAVGIAAQMGFWGDRLEAIQLAGLFHDVGKMILPKELFTNTDELTPEELRAIRKHPNVGYSVLREIGFSEHICQIVLEHHERVDGSGYPNGLKGDRILLEAKILAVADVIDAMTSNRPYNQHLPDSAALDEVSKVKSYDQMVTHAYISLRSGRA